jgi:hypothetical protein
MSVFHLETKTIYKETLIGCVLYLQPTAHKAHASMTSESPMTSASLSLCTLPDITEEGQTKLWCKDCNACLDISNFIVRERLYLMCREHLMSKAAMQKKQVAYKAMRDASWFCKTTGIELLLIVQDVQVMELEHYMSDLYLVPLRRC